MRQGGWWEISIPAPLPPKSRRSHSLAQPIPVLLTGALRHLEELTTGSVTPQLTPREAMPFGKGSLLRGGQEAPTTCLLQRAPTEQGREARDLGRTKGSLVGRGGEGSAYSHSTHSTWSPGAKGQGAPLWTPTGGALALVWDGFLQGPGASITQRGQLSLKQGAPGCS